MIVRDLVDAAHAAEQLQQPPHLALPDRRASPAMSRTRGGRKRSPPASSGADLRPQLLVGRSEPHLMAGQPHPGAVERNFVLSRKLLQHRQRRPAPAGAASSCSRSRSSPMPGQIGIVARGSPRASP